MTTDSTETSPFEPSQEVAAPENAGGPASESKAAEESAAPMDQMTDAAVAEEAAPPPTPAEQSPIEVPAAKYEPEPEAAEREHTLQLAPADEAEIDPTKLDPDAVKVVHRLRQFGHEVYFVGGCVRDLLLGRTPKDFDIATSATPNEVRNVFRNCRLIGRRFRLAHVYFKGGKIIEVSTFRANPTELEDPAALAGAPVDGENGAVEGEEDDLLITHDNVFGTAEQDARRRDFTVNGLFYDPFSGKVQDYVRGRRDLDERNIRTIGNPEVRMREDPVRILRAVRFACKLDLDIESRTYAAMEGAVEDLPRCAQARLLEETFRLIRGGTASKALKLVAALDALKILLPPVDDYLRRSGAQAEERFYAHTRALDRRISGGEALEDAVILAAILLPIANAAPEVVEDENHPPSVAQAIEDLLSEMVRNARLPRRIAERCRMILIAQRTLTGQRRRRGSLQSFRRHPLFHESLAVFEISVEATGEFKEQLDAWKTGSAPSVAPDAEGPKRKRRRRRRKRKGEGAGAAVTGAPDGAAEASEATEGDNAGEDAEDSDAAGADEDTGGDEDESDEV